MDSQEFPHLSCLLSASDPNENCQLQQNSSKLDESLDLYSQNLFKSSMNFPKTPIKAKVKFAVGKIQRNLDSIEEKETYLHNFYRNDRQPIDNESMELLPILQDSLLLEQNSTEFKWLEFFAHDSTDQTTATEFFQPTAFVNFDNLNQNPGDLAELTFNRLAFSQNDEELNSLIQAYCKIQNHSGYSVSLTQFLAILAAYGANLNLIPLCVDLKNNVLTYLNSISNYFEIPKSRLVNNLAAVISMIGNFLNQNLDEIVTWFCLFLALTVDGYVKSEEFLEIRIQNSVFSMFALLMPANETEIRSRLIEFLKCYIEDPLILADLCRTIDNCVVDHSFTVRAGIEISRRIFDLPGNLIGNLEIDEFSTVIEQIDSNLSDLLTNHKRLVCGFLSILDVCLSIDYLNGQNLNQLRRISNSFRRWQSLMEVQYAGAPALKSLLFSLIVRMPANVTDDVIITDPQVRLRDSGVSLNNPLPIESLALNATADTVKLEVDDLSQDMDNIML